MPLSTNDYSKDGLYLGFKYNYTDADVSKLAEKFSAEVVNATNDTVVDLLLNKNIVCFYQGRSENGPRALGNRSILFSLS